MILLHVNVASLWKLAGQGPQARNARQRRAMTHRRQYLQQHDINEASAQFTLSLSLRNACVFFFDDRQTMP